MFHWFSFPSFCFKNVSWHDMQTKNFQQLQPECQHVGLHVHYRNYSQTAKSPKRVHITSLVNIVQQCSPVAHDKDWPKNRDGQGQDTVTENRKTPAKHPDGTTEVLKVHIRRFATKEQYKVKTVGRCKDLQLEQTGFQAVTCDSNVYRLQNLSKMPLSHKRKTKVP